MKKKKGRTAQKAKIELGSTASPSQSKKRWQEPKLAFVEPKLTKHGELKEVTGQFFGAFSP